MRTLHFGEKKVETMAVNYYLLADELGSEFESYGVEVCCSNGDQAAVRGVTISQSKILLLMSMLMEYAVTPVALRDVVDDFLVM